MDHEPTVELTEAEWLEKLGPERYAILRKAATEAPGTGSLLYQDNEGTFSCAGCGTALFTSEMKFDSGCGWPSFDRALDNGSVGERPDNSLFMRRTEIFCTTCGGHLGHVFNDGPTATGLRYCVNSLSLEFDPS